MKKRFCRVLELKKDFVSGWTCHFQIPKPSLIYPETPPPVDYLCLLSAFLKSVRKLKAPIPYFIIILIDISIHSVEIYTKMKSCSED
jgi:hypothetical protein